MLAFLLILQERLPPKRTLHRDHGIRCIVEKTMPSYIRSRLPVVITNFPLAAVHARAQHAPDIVFTVGSELITIIHCLDSWQVETGTDDIGLFDTFQLAS
jgi:hypothetical protein